MLALLPRAASPEDALHKSSSILPFVLYLSTSFIPSPPPYVYQQPFSGDTGDSTKHYGIWLGEGRGGGLLLQGGKK